jgi:aspartyl-tRNA(Asn)/glutamyl-tRNA(Gln) amidotransferase subunit B
MLWETVIGLEVHVQLATKSKIFSGASTAYGASANEQACAVDVALPGVLPVLNERVVDLAIRLGLAIEGDIATSSTFARKNYFYPDSPKGYQISQFEDPIVSNGRLKILSEADTKIINITRAHLEEDAGKSIHDEYADITAIDLNRAGTPLLEVVSEPEMSSAKEAVSYLKELHYLVTSIGICDGNMQEGSFRCDANISIRERGTNILGTRTEVKNLNSFRYVEKAINFEITRQREVLEDGGEVTQETRLFDPDKNETRVMRTKEDAHDYRYFPDPDLLPVLISKEKIDNVRAALPETPWNKRARYMKEYGLSTDEASALANDYSVARYFENCIVGSELPAKLVSHWIAGELFSLLNKNSTTITLSQVKPTALSKLLGKIAQKEISANAGKRVLEIMWETQKDVDQIIDEEQLIQISDDTVLQKVVDKIVKNYPKQVGEYKEGKEKILGFLVGQVLKETKGQANPSVAKTLLEQTLGN